MPSTQEEWSSVADKFNSMWNFPHCVGTVDGKHVVIVAPPNSGSTYYNYKGTHSIVLMAIADAQYKFLYIDVGCNGRVSEGGVFNKCSFAAAMITGALNLPEESPLQGRTMDQPFVIVADDAFALRINVMKPFPGRSLNAAQRIYNYRLSRARRVVENAFGILSARFRVLLKAINLDANKAKRITLACCALHNFLIEKSPGYAGGGMPDRYACDGEFIPGEWRRFAQVEESGTEDMPSQYMPPTATAIREEFKEYFTSIDGELPWQYKFI